jgi:peroxiredoxin
MTASLPSPTSPLLQPGDPIPHFIARSADGAPYHMGTVGGRHVVLMLFGSAADPSARATLDLVLQHRGRFDDRETCLFGISIDAEDAGRPGIADQIPGIRFLWDTDGAISRSLQALDPKLPAGAQPYRRHTLLLDPSLRVLACIDAVDPEAHVRQLLACLDGLPPIAAYEAAVRAPVLIVPRLFEPEFCQVLIDHYDGQGGRDSGFMRDQEGQTVGLIDYQLKRRRDVFIRDERLQAAIRGRIVRRLLPEIERAFQFRATRIERYLVACYDAGDGGYFRPHRDNVARATAHRRFAVTINLNAEDYEGGDLRLPEFGPRTYRAPTGGAVVFSCSLLHEALPVTDGRRYACLPFLYDEAAAKIREANAHHLKETAGC